MQNELEDNAELLEEVDSLQKRMASLKEEYELSLLEI
jgi:hypothetical protein